MSDRVVFGHFLDAAHEQFSSGYPEAAQGRGDIQQVNDNLLRVLILMSRYVQDVAAGAGTVPARRRRVLTAWGRASVEAREALSNAAGSLYEAGARRLPGRPASELARRLDSAAQSLEVGRDLLHTHLSRGPGGEQEWRSEWGPVINSPKVSRAVLVEIATLARQIAPLGARFALAPGSHGAPWTRSKLNAACQWLWVLNTCVEAAQHEDPLPAADVELLCAIPVNAAPPRRLPGASEPVAGLCTGVIGAAERVRHSEWQAGQQPPWSPGLSADSLRQLAVTCTVTSHNCGVLLRSLVVRLHKRGELSSGLLHAAEAAGRARDGWIQVAHALDRVTTDTRGFLSPSAVASGDLALWTGKLAYADPEWTLASGPTHELRQPDNLAPGPTDIPLAVSAVHYACDTLTTVAYAEREQVRAAGIAQRILVPTRSLPDTVDVPRPFAPALPDRIVALVSLYGDSGRAAGEATAAVGDVAAAIGAPSRVLGLARAAASPGHYGDGVRASPPAVKPNGRLVASHRHAGPEPRELPGPVERALHDLGVTDVDLLQRGTDLDRTAERLIIDAAAKLGPGRKRPSAATLSGSASSAGLMDHALAFGDIRSNAHRREAFAQSQAREAEP